MIMPNKGENGHSSKVINLNELISFLPGYGKVFNPSKHANLCNFVMPQQHGQQQQPC